MLTDRPGVMWAAVRRQVVAETLARVTGSVLAEFAHRLAAEVVLDQGVLTSSGNGRRDRTMGPDRGAGVPGVVGVQVERQAHRGKQVGGGADARVCRRG